MNEEHAFNLRQSITQTYEEVTQSIFDFAPQLLGALLLILIGGVVAFAARAVVRRLFGGVDAILKRVASADGERQARLRSSFGLILSRIIFWAVMLFFFAAAANLLGWTLFSDWMEGLVGYLPRLITGLLLVLAGLLLGTGAKAVVARAAHSAEMEEAELFGRVAQLIVIFTMIVIGVEQAGINVRFLTEILVVLVGTLFAGGALAFGLGAKTLVANVIGAQHSRKHCRVGESLKLLDTEGTVVEISQTAIILETNSGRAVVPARLFNEQVSHFSTSVEAPRSAGEARKEEPSNEG